MPIGRNVKKSKMLNIRTSLPKMTVRSALKEKQFRNFRNSSEHTSVHGRVFLEKKRIVVCSSTFERSFRLILKNLLKASMSM